MKKSFIVANWKSNKTENQIREWFKTFQATDYRRQTTDEKEVIICSSFVHLSLVRNLIKESNLPFKVGAQDISPFDEGAYTGAVNGKQIKEYADYVIIGHSERRKNFEETDEITAKKFQEAIKEGLTPVFCVQNANTLFPDEVKIIAYEPPTSISTSGPNARADDPKEVAKVAQQLKTKGSSQVLYGGSVDSLNVNEFTKLKEIDGVLVGGASLDAQKFTEIIKNA